MDRRIAKVVQGEQISIISSKHQKLTILVNDNEIDIFMLEFTPSVITRIFTQYRAGIVGHSRNYTVLFVNKFIRKYYCGNLVLSSKSMEKDYYEEGISVAFSGKYCYYGCALKSVESEWNIRHGYLTIYDKIKAI